MDLNALDFDNLVPSQSKYLAKGDVGEDGLILTIRGFKMESVKADEGDEDKVVMYFMEDVKPMIVNRTNSQLIGVATGTRTAGEAKGKQIVVYNDPTVGFGGKITGGLRIKKVAGAPKSAPARAEFEDKVPF